MSMLTAYVGGNRQHPQVEHMEGGRILYSFRRSCRSPGANKSHPLSFAMQPLIDFDAEQSAIFNEAMKRYGAAMSCTERKTANATTPNPTEPRRIRFHHAGCNPEAVHRILSENRGGCASMPTNSPHGSRTSTATTTAPNPSSGCRCSTTR